MAISYELTYISCELMYLVPVAIDNTEHIIISRLPLLQLFNPFA